VTREHCCGSCARRQPWSAGGLHGEGIAATLRHAVLCCCGCHIVGFCGSRGCPALQRVMGTPAWPQVLSLFNRMVIWHSACVEKLSRQPLQQAFGWKARLQDMRVSAQRTPRCDAAETRHNLDLFLIAKMACYCSRNSSFSGAVCMLQR
jgi:hypothetical protein